MAMRARRGRLPGDADGAVLAGLGRHRFPSPPRGRRLAGRMRPALDPWECERKVVCEGLQGLEEGSLEIDS